MKDLIVRISHKNCKKRKKFSFPSFFPWPPRSTTSAFRTQIYFYMYATHTAHYIPLDLFIPIPLGEECMNVFVK